ncbi:MAG TPA: cupin domain-containing protein [Dehalococcoidia bacterium]|nr:cupin domain-containing protein [Dehalococcoidia bacterium]
MSRFETVRLADAPVVLAPDGGSVRILPALAGGSFAEFSLAPGETSTAVAHRSVEEIWFVTGGRGEIWRSQDGRAEVTPLETGICVTVPLGTHFQFRCLGPETLTAIAVTMPPWPGEDEAFFVEGAWTPTVPR